MVAQVPEGYRGSAPTLLQAPCGHLERVVDAELSESARCDAFLEEEAVDVLRSEARSM